MAYDPFEVLPEDRLFILPLGIGNAFTSLHFNSSFLVFAEGRAIAVDCPAPYRRVLRGATERLGIELDIDRIDHIVLTHLHADHCGGLEEIGFYKTFVLEEQRTQLYTLSQLVKPLWRERLALNMENISDVDGPGKRIVTMEQYFDAHGWTEGRTWSLGEPDSELEMTIRITRHSVPCFGFLMKLGDYTLGYSADTPFEEAHIEFLSEADLIIHEVGPPPNHAPLEKIMTVSEEIRKKMLLTHLPDSFDIANSPIPCLKEGALYCVGEGRKPLSLEEDEE